MKYLNILLITLILLVSCGEEDASTPAPPPEDINQCDVYRVNGGTMIDCGDSKSIIYDGSNGLDGQNGSDGQDGLDGEDGVTTIVYDVLEVIDPCGPSGDFDEILLVTQNNDFISYYEYRKKRFLTKLEPGEYETNDAQKCKFEIFVDESGDLEYRDLE